MAYYKCGRVYVTQNSNTAISNVGPSKIASFSTSLALPLVSLKASIVATESGSGTKSPSNPYTLGGFSNAVITRSSVNLWDEQVVNGYLSSTDGSFIANANSICSKNFCKCNAGEAVYINSFTTPSLYVVFYDKNKAFISHALGNNQSVSVPNNACFFRVSVYGYGATYNNDISINYPSTDTTYHAYTATQTTLALGQTVYGGYVVQDKDGHRQLVVTWCDITDLGSLMWNNASSGRTICNPSNMAVAQSSAIVGNILSNSYKADTHNNVWNRITDKTIAMTNNPNAKMLLYDSDLGNKTTTEVKAYLTGKSVIYELAEPFTVALPDGEPIIAFNGVNNVWSDTGDIEVSYRNLV